MHAHMHASCAHHVGMSKNWLWKQNEYVLPRSQSTGEDEALRAIAACRAHRGEAGEAGGVACAACAACAACSECGSIVT